MQPLLYTDKQIIVFSNVLANAYDNSHKKKISSKGACLLELINLIFILKNYNYINLSIYDSKFYNKLFLNSNI